MSDRGHSFGCGYIHGRGGCSCGWLEILSMTNNVALIKGLHIANVLVRYDSTFEEDILKWTGVDHFTLEELCSKSIPKHLELRTQQLLKKTYDRWLLNGP